MKAILNFLVYGSPDAKIAHSDATRSLDCLQSLAITRSNSAIRKIGDAAKQLRNGYANEKLTLPAVKNRILDGSKDKNKG